MAGVAERLRAIQVRVEAAAARAGRDPASVILIAVSKTQSVQAVQEAVDAGARVLGENYVQEMLAKQDEVSGAQWHFIGHLQSNKAREVVGRVALVHSVDRARLADALSRRSVEADVETQVLIEVNVGGEASKSGVAPEEALDLARHISALAGIKLRGLMTIPPRVEDPEESRGAFRALAALAREIDAAHLDGVVMDVLSMGMSGDFEVAIEEGATHVRVGTAIFGPRPPKAP